MQLQKHFLPIVSSPENCLNSANRATWIQAMVTLGLDHCNGFYMGLPLQSTPIFTKDCNSGIIRNKAEHSYYTHYAASLSAIHRPPGSMQHNIQSFLWPSVLVSAETPCLRKNRISYLNRAFCRYYQVNRQ